ncbi:MAG TPA: response regulator [Terriglobales bacterium]|jgi:DNA-binding NtrC family response regulator|nr:response regulator [Terriglobales bacterium]
MKKRKHSVLVVDDEASVLFTYRVLLEQHGYAATAVLSSKEAIAAIEKTAFDLLLCDLSLEEGHTGFEVLEFARQTNPEIPCVLLTGYASSEAAQKAEQLGIDVLYKPIEIQQFLETISTVLKENYEQTEDGKRAHRSQAS